MQISFGDGAQEAFQLVAQSVPQGYAVALLDKGEELPPGPLFAKGVDVILVGTCPEGVAYRESLVDRAVPVGPIKIRPWEAVARIHVY